MKIRLLPSMSITQMASHAARLCYTTKIPKLGKMIDVFKSLFTVSHHTTLQHAVTYETFEIEGIPVSEVTFGLHLTHPFYDTDQRSGRYAGKMFKSPDYRLMLNYIRRHYPEVTKEQLAAIHEYLKLGCLFYRAVTPDAKVLAQRFLREERPYIKEEQLQLIAKKITQEQARMFIPTIFPTALVFTVNFTALVAMWQEAWTPGMKDLVGRMVKLYVQKHPDTRKYFDFVDDGTERSFALTVPSLEDVVILDSPQLLYECDVLYPELFVEPEQEQLHPVDRLHFAPELMDNNIGGVKSRVAVSVATYGQDQRHRTVKRGTPHFCGGFYLPPLLQNERGEAFGWEIMKAWTEVSSALPDTLSMLLAPYGVMVEYDKLGSFNAKIHEQGKRLCFAAQEEIYNLSRLERASVEMRMGSDAPVLSMYQPPCFKTGKCAEGGRYCGRTLNTLKSQFFPSRKV